MAGGSIHGHQIASSKPKNANKLKRTTFSSFVDPSRAAEGAGIKKGDRGVANISQSFREHRNHDRGCFPKLGKWNPSATNAKSIRFFDSFNIKYISKRNTTQPQTPKPDFPCY